MIFLNLFLFKTLKTDDPNNPLWPAKKILGWKPKNNLDNLISDMISSK